MAEDLDDGEFWLPSQFLTDEEENDDLHHLLMNKIHSIRFGSYGVTASPLLSKRPISPVVEPEPEPEPATMMVMMTSSTTLTDDDRENHPTGSTCQIPRFKQKERVMSGSPKSPLCDIGNWSAFSCCSSGGGGGSSRGSPICSSLVSSPPSSTPPQNVKQEDPLDLLNAAAGQIGRLKMNEEEEEEEEGQHRHNNHHHSDLLAPPPPSPLQITTTPLSSSSKVKVKVKVKVKKNLPNNKLGLFSNEALIQQQLQNAHQFQQLRKQQQQQQSVLQQQQQLLRQQLSAAWGGWQRKVVPPALPPQQQQQQQVQSSKRCARPHQHQQQQGSGTSKESCGTGVFIPRRRSSSIPTAETPKKPAGCHAVLVPAKVVPAPNLNFNAMGGDTGGVLTSNEHVKCSSPIQLTRTASDAVILSGQQHQPQNVASHEICLPKEWTY